MIEELRRQQAEIVRRKIAVEKRKRKRLLILALCVGFLCFLAIQLFSSRHFEITYYKLESEKVDNSIKIAVLSDLHGVEYGERNSELIEAIRKEQPDFIAMIGDMVNKDDSDFTALRYLCRELKEIAPVYYSLGNHEGTILYGRLDSVPLDEMLREDGVNVLINQTTEFKKGETIVQIAGTSNGEADYDKWARGKLEKFWDMEEYKIVLSHFPNLYYDKLKDEKFDLALAGHYHGGLIRIPGLEGLYHPEGGFFPQYSGGKYPLTNGTLIVSRGLGGHGWIPRINNPPELVIIEIR